MGVFVWWEMSPIRVSLFLFRADVPGGYRGRREVVRQLAFQRGKQRLVEAVLRKVPPHGIGKHLIQLFQCPAGLPALTPDCGGAEKNRRREKSRIPMMSYHFTAHV